MLIDWLSFDLPYLGARVYSHEFIREWDTEEIVPRRVSWAKVEGSFSSKIKVMAAEGRMHISGNPVKFFTGQNIVGTRDLQELVLLTYEAVLIVLGLPDCSYARKAIKEGTVNLTRVDVTRHWHVGTDDDVRVFLQAVGDRATIRKRGRGHFNSDFCSVGWGFGKDMTNGEAKRKGSRRSSFKLYNKFEEIKRHKMTCPDVVQQLLTKWVEGKVRVEACYRGYELGRLGYKLSRDWDWEAPNALLNLFLERLEMPDQVVLTDERTNELPRALRMTFETWKSGVDVKSLMAKNTFYRHRRAILEYGVDIGTPPINRKETGRVIHLIKILEASPADCPHDHLFEELAVNGYEQMKEEAQRRAAA